MSESPLPPPDAVQEGGTEPSPEVVLRAWRDPLYRAALTGPVRTVLPSHPACDIGIPGLDSE